MQLFMATTSGKRDEARLYKGAISLRSKLNSGRHGCGVRARNLCLLLSREFLILSEVGDGVFEDMTEHFDDGDIIEVLVLLVCSPNLYSNYIL